MGLVKDPDPAVTAKRDAEGPRQDKGGGGKGPSPIILSPTK